MDKACTLLGFGEVMHRRLHPTIHAFRYGLYFLHLPMRNLPSRGGNHWLGINKPGLMSFYDCDHGDGSSSSLKWLDDFLQRHGITDAHGQVWLQCFPRVLGYVFNPVSFWFCHRADGSLRCVVAEVNNTFGERSCYLLNPSVNTSQAIGWGQWLSAEKVMHVSPFAEIAGHYRFCFMQTEHDSLPARYVARVEYWSGKATHPDRPLLNTSISGALKPASKSQVIYALLRYPLMTFMVMARIHLQALKLWLKRVPVYTHTPKSTPLTHPHKPNRV